MRCASRSGSLPLDEARYSASYKLATLLALIDVIAERTGPGSSLPESVPPRRSAAESGSVDEKVIYGPGRLFRPLRTWCPFRSPYGK